MIDELDRDEGAVLMSEKEEKKAKEVRNNTGDAQVEGRQADIYQIDMDHAAKVLSMQDDELEVQEAVESMQEDESKVQEAVEAVTTIKLIIEFVAAVSETVSAAAVVPIGDKMHKAFPLPVMEFPLSKEVPTASEESSP
nr:hypothetical protein [Tanacetum cinerariifolium]